jgi:uncharacterized membrane protein YhaH (DUF805 family)
MNLYFWLTWIMASVVFGLIAKTTKLGFWGGFLISLILTPLIGLIAVLSVDQKKEKS